MTSHGTPAQPPRNRLVLPATRPVDPAYSYPPVRFSLADAQRAADSWGANCGPGAIAGVLGLTLEELRPHLGDFESKGYTNPTLMLQVLRRLRVDFRECRVNHLWPIYGIARVQWEGPWLEPGVPVAARYRFTHWVGARAPVGRVTEVFDINCMSVGGWVSINQWTDDLVPWLLRTCYPRANGRWHLTHSIEVFSRAELLS